MKMQSVTRQTFWERKQQNR